MEVGIKRVTCGQTGDRYRDGQDAKGVVDGWMDVKGQEEI